MVLAVDQEREREFTTQQWINNIKKNTYTYNFNPKPLT